MVTIIFVSQSITGDICFTDEAQLPFSSLTSVFGMNAEEFGQGQVPLRMIFAYISESSFSYECSTIPPKAYQFTIVPLSLLVVLAAFFLALHSKVRHVLMLLLRVVGAYVALVLPRNTLDGTLRALEAKLEQLRARRKG